MKKEQFRFTSDKLLSTDDILQAMWDNYRGKVKDVYFESYTRTRMGKDNWEITINVLINEN
jgi:hypothetical protein